MSNRFTRGSVIFLGLTLGLLFVARLTLPFWLKGYVNRTLDSIPGYSGFVEDIEVSLWRGAYVIHGMKLRKREGAVHLPFFSSRKADLSVEWKSLFNGALVGEIEFYQPELNFIKAANSDATQKPEGRSWKKAVKDLFPLRFNRFALLDGSIHYRDFESSPPVDVSLDNIFAEATNLTNSEKISKTLVATLRGNARAEKHAPVNFFLEMDPYKDEPTFNMDASLENLDLVHLNDLLNAYGNFDAEKGTFSFYTEIASQDGFFRGYAKPIFHDVSIVSLKADLENPFKLVWEGVISSFLEIFTNQRHDQIATKVPLSGKFENPKADLWVTVWEVISNAFISALSPEVEGSISFSDALKEKKSEE